jgi:hypothetical protein
MAKTKTITKANKAKLNKVAQTLQAFTASTAATAASSSAPVVSITDIYTIGNSGNQITFSLVFKTKGVGALTDAVLHNVTSPDKPIVTGGKDSLLNIPLGIDTSLNGIFLKINSVVAATNLTTPLPAALDVDFSLMGGQVTKNFPLPNRQFNKVGDSFILDFTIIIFQS